MKLNYYLGPLVDAMGFWCINYFSYDAVAQYFHVFSLDCHAVNPVTVCIPAFFHDLQSSYTAGLL